MRYSTWEEVFFLRLTLCEIIEAGEWNFYLRFPSREIKIYFGVSSKVLFSLLAATETGFKLSS